MIIDTSFDVPHATVRFTRRRLLGLAGGAAGIGLLTVSGIAHAETQRRTGAEELTNAVAAVLTPNQASRALLRAAPLANFQQATQSGFNPINSSLTFGAPVDLASGWDGTVWAIDGSGAPHLYDPLTDSWQLHGTGVNAAALINDEGPAVYFRGGEVFIADGRTTASAIATVWPQLPPSYRKFGVKGAAWAAGKLVLFRGGTYLTVPSPGSTQTSVAAPTPGMAEAEPIYNDALQAASTTTPTSAASHTATPAATTAPTRTPTPPVATPTDPSTPAASPTAAMTRTPGATAAALSTPVASPTRTPGVVGSPTPLVTPTMIASPSPTREPSLTPTATPTPASLGAASTDYVASPLTGITSWPQTGNWQHGVIDGVYSQGHNVVLLVSGGEFVTLTFTDGAPPTASGPTPLNQHASFAPLPADWLANGFDAGFFTVGGPAANNAYVFNGPQLMVYGVQVGAQERATSPASDVSPTPTATPSPGTEVVGTARPSVTASATPTPAATAAAGTPVPPEQTPAPPRAAAPLYHAALLAAGTATPGDAASGSQASVTPTGGSAPNATRTVASTPSPTRTVDGTPTAAGTPTTTPNGTPSSTPTPTGSLTSTPTPSPTPQAGGPSVDLLRLGSPSPALHYVAAAAGGWPATWHPTLQHAPSGRASALWCATVDGRIVNFDGTTWTQPPGDALSVAAGKDGAVFAVGKQNPQQLSQWNGNAFSPVATHSSPLSQVSVGTQSQVWTRDSNSAVHQLTQGQLQPVALAGSAVHIAANYDGTLWSCTGADPHALRLAPDLQQPPATVPAAGTVQKVASTGFGAAHCLVGQGGSAQLYRYDSPYVFRTPDTYDFTTGQAIEQGLGSLFFLVQSHEDSLTQSAPPTYQVVALDTHTGVELSRSAVAPSHLRYTAPTFDSIHETVIVGLTTNPYAPGPQPGQLLGLDARDLSKVRWSITLPNNLSLGPGRPTLQGTLLCISDNVNTLVMYDTGSAPTATTPTYRWTYAYPIGSQDAHILPPPVLANGTVYAAWWLFSTQYGYLQPWLWMLDAATGTGTPTALPTGAGTSYYYDNDPRGSSVWASAAPSMALYPPVLATLPGASAAQSRQVLFVNGGTRVWGVDTGALTVKAYVLYGSTFGSDPNTSGPGSKIISGLSVANGVVWFGDDGSNLHGVEGQQMTAVPNTPTAPTPGQGIVTTPLPYTDAQGEAAVLVSVAGALQPALLVFDPTSGNVVSIPTQGTNFISLSTRVTNGVVYAGGGPASGTTSGPVAQVFGIRVDQAVQELRDFIVDSQLMQDFDDPSQPTHNPNGVARYQTHLTLVDNARAPLVNEAVKLWADQPNTTVLINNQSYTIGPDDDQFASVKTSSAGQLLIVSGSTQADGSDKADMNAVPLRAWAPFMNHYERMLIIRDQEFHNRVATAHATDAGQAGADDPTRANLQTAQTYGDLQNQGTGTSNSLFTDQQKQDNQPHQVASAIQTMTGSVGSAPPAGSKTLKASFALHATDTPGKYVSYTDTPGAQYSPVNVAANRAAVVLQTTGLSFSQDSSGTPGFSTTTPASATLAIDGLDGADWSTSPYAPPHVQAAASAAAVGGRRLLGGDFWSDFWGWLKGAVATVTHVIVSVAEDIYAGIRILVNGVAYVFTTIISGIEQVANAIGAFFIELGHLIEEFIEALSVLFQFGHIIDTHNRLKAELLNRINGVPNNASYPGFANLVTSSVLTPVNTFFESSEQTVSNWLNSMADALGGTPANGLPGGGSTAHSAFSVAPSGGGSSSSTSTQSGWALNKFNGGVGASSTAAAAALAGARPLLGDDDPIATIFTTFIATLTNDPVLGSQWQQVKSGAQGLSNASSAADFVKQGIAELLRILAGLIDGVLGVGKALVNSLLAGVTSLIDAMFGPNGWLVTPIEFPVLSWLYQTLFGEPLTILNAVLLLVSIPVTLLWRIIEGSWPADSFGTTPAALGAAPAGTQLGAAPAGTQKILTYTNAILSMVLGFVYGAGDIEGSGNVPPILGRAALALSVTQSACTAPSYTSDTPTVLDWSSWGLSLTGALLNVLGSVSFSSATTSQNVSNFTPGLLSALSIAQLLVLGLEFDPDYGEVPTNAAGDAALGLDIASQLAGLINPAKLESEVGAVVVAAVDVIMGFASMVAAFLSMSATQDRDVRGAVGRAAR